MVKKCLEKYAEVIVTATLANAVAAVVDGHYDLIVTDYMLPEGSSMPFVRDIRKQFLPNELPIILVSGSLDKTMVSEALQSGVNECLQKPLQRDSFVEIVRRMLSEPYVSHMPDGCDTYTSIQWVQEGQSFIFCPELGETVQGTNPLEASAAMLALVQMHVHSGHPLDWIHDVRVESRFLEA